MAGPGRNATAVTVGLLVLLAGRVVGPVVSVAHEGGHMAIGFLTGGKVEYFRLKPDSVNAETKFDRLSGWLGDILTTFAGYVTPPLLGLGGAVLLKEGHAWPRQIQPVEAFNSTSSVNNSEGFFQL
jgi:hypothetical protein